MTAGIPHGRPSAQPLPTRTREIDPPDSSNQNRRFRRQNRIQAEYRPQRKGLTQHAFTPRLDPCRIQLTSRLTAHLRGCASPELVERRIVQSGPRTRNVGVFLRKTAPAAADPSRNRTGGCPRTHNRVPRIRFRPTVHSPAGTVRRPTHFATDGSLVRLHQPRVRRPTEIAQRAAHSESAGYIEACLSSLRGIFYL